MEYSNTLVTKSLAMPHIVKLNQNILSEINERGQPKVKGQIQRSQKSQPIAYLRNLGKLYEK